MITYQRLMAEISHLSRFGIKTGFIGKSRCRRDIPYIFAGCKTGKTVFITAGIHAREHIGIFCVMRQVYHTLNNLFCKNYREGGIYFIPCVNPDGLEIARRPDCRLWKANACGVDLNVNFDANWGTGKQNVFAPAPENYVGPAPFSEPESKALRDFTLLKQPCATVSYHCKGRELYWEFGQSEPDRTRDKRLAAVLNENLNYTVKGDDGTSAGGYKDWCIQKLKIPSFTIELADDRLQHPICDYCAAQEDIRRNLDLPMKLLKELIC